MPENKDDLARECFKKNKNSVISWILMASYGYYVLNESLLSDEVFDKMCLYVYEHYDKLEHKHKHLITKEDMQAGTLFSLSHKDYPLIVQVIVGQMVAQDRSKI